ncbi:helix-turn-helix domain-containing protein [Streptomyces sp. NPDC020917]|uniref:helix-turn-helix domain-containing protein n=1 Tax=Streptomyces sp. NPDC020917 TaxID=3365102 RepID=UPI0037A512CD
MAGSAENTEGSASGIGGEPESSDSLRTFGAFLQALREHAGYSREEFAAVVRFSKHTVASVEQGRRIPDVDFVERSEQATGNTGALRSAARHIARQPGLASWFRRWARLESHAITLYTYECRLIPGLLQTEAYARRLFDQRLPPLSDADIDAQLAARLDRQRLLKERPHTAFGFVLDEHLFTRTTGGSAVTRELIDHVLEVGAQRNVEVQVLPTSVDVHPGLDGPIVLQETPENRWFAYNEGQETGQFISDPKVVSVLQQRYVKLRAQALTSEDSTSLLERMRGAL